MVREVAAIKWSERWLQLSGQRGGWISTGVFREVAGIVLEWSERWLDLSVREMAEIE